MKASDHLRDWLRLELRVRKLNLEELARATQVSAPTWSRMLTGVTQNLKRIHDRQCYFRRVIAAHVRD